MEVQLKTLEEIDKIRAAGKIVDEVLTKVTDAADVGVTTRELDTFAREIIDGRAEPAFLDYPNSNPNKPSFPGVLCTSVNAEVVHGVPNDQPLVEGDVLSVDFGCCVDGFFADSARTVAIGEANSADRRLMNATQAALQAAIDAAQPGGRLFDIGEAIEGVINPHGYGIVRDLMGHGIGRNLHEEPSVPNFKPGILQFWRNHVLNPGLVIAIEPMITAGSGNIEVLDDDWTVVTKDGSKAAHYEHTIAITKDGPIILTLDL